MSVRSRQQTTCLIITIAIISIFCFSKCHHIFHLKWSRFDESVEIVFILVVHSLLHSQREKERKKTVLSSHYHRATYTSYNFGRCKNKNKIMILINLWAVSTHTHNIEIEWQQSPAQQKTRWRINFARLFSIFIVVNKVHVMDVNLNSIVNSRRSGACERCVHVSGFEAHVKVFSVRLNANEMSWKFRRRSKKLIGAHYLRIFNQFDRNVWFSIENLGNLVIKCDEYINQYAHFMREWADCFFL